jgi:hypothetical protein
MKNSEPRTKNQELRTQKPEPLILNSEHNAPSPFFALSLPRLSEPKTQNSELKTLSLHLR